VKDNFRGAMQKFKAARRKQLESMVSKHKTPTQMAQALGVSRQRVHQLLTEFNLKEPQS
jgi:DNA-directed RNA polymerase specialized sigma subunit